MIELYIHLPFCVKKCNYCDFLSFHGIYEGFRKEYFLKLNKELAFYGEQYKNPVVRSVFIGGGTPGMVATEEIQELLENIKKFYRLSKDCEITIETNPGVADKEKLKAFRESGINRLSIGVQSFDDRVLKLMGRIHNSEDAIKAYETGRYAGFENINLDLILGYPGQSVETFRNTLEQVVALAPEHISAYSLIVEEGTALYDDIEKGKIPEPDDEADRKMYELACEMLASSGYERYEISNFAKSGRESIHNLGYWTGVPYIGVGLGATSFVEGVRYKNVCDVKEYISVEPEAIRDSSETEVLSLKEQMDEFMMLGFRLKKGPDRNLFSYKFGVDYMDIYADKLQKLCSAGLIERSGTNYCLSVKGLDLGNEVFGEFI